MQMKTGKCAISFLSRLVVVFLFISILLYGVSVNAQASFNFQHFPADHPLSHPIIQGITQDRQGFIWFGTKQGLIRFDGIHTLIFKHRPFDAASICSNDVWAVCEDHEQPLLWVATLGGLARLDLLKKQFRNYLYHPDSLLTRSGPSAKDITCVTQGEDGKVWLGTGGGGLNSFDPETEKFTYYYPNSTTDYKSDYNHLGYVGEDARGHIWFGTQAGLLRLDPASGEMTSFRKDIGLLKTNFALTIDSAGQVWACTQKGIFRYDERKETFRRLPVDTTGWKKRFGVGWSAVYPETMLVDQQGQLWFGGWDTGLFVFDEKTAQLRHFQHDDSNTASIGHNSIYTLFADRNQRLWIGTNGVDRLDPYFQKFEFIPLNKHPDNKGSVPVGGISEDPSGNLWLSSIGNGITRFNPVEYTQQSFFPAPPGPGSVRNFIRNTLPAPDGRLWVETWMTGLHTFDPVSKRFFSFPDIEGLSVPPDRFWQLDEEMIAFRAERKLYFYELEKGVATTLPDSFATIYSGPPFLPTLMKDSKEFIWLGLEDEGLVRYDPRSQQCIQFLQDPANRLSLSGNKVYALLEDQKGNIWIGTYEQGLNLLIWPEEPGGDPYFRHWLESNSRLPSNQILAMQEDAQGIIWICTDNGITRFDPEKESFQPYDARQCGQRFFWPQVTHQSRDGMIYFGGMQGITAFHPERMAVNTQAPPVVLTQLRIDNQVVDVGAPGADHSQKAIPLALPIEYTEAINLTYDQNDFTLAFAVLDYTAPEMNRYQYRLEGYQEDWIAMDGILPEANYTNISPGQYRFQVRGSNPDGTLNQEDRVLNIVIRPPWWRTGWAIGAYIILVLMGAVIIHRYELRRRLAKAEAQQHRELFRFQSRLYTNITHEFRTPLTVILGLVDQLTPQVSEHAKNSLKVIRRNGNQLLNLVNQLLDLARLESGHEKFELMQGDIITFLSSLMDSFHALADKKSIELEFRSHLNELYMDYDPNRLMQVMSNLLSNAIKFSPEGGAVFVSIHHDAKHPNISAGALIIKVKDTGNGIPEASLPYIFNRFYQAPLSAPKRKGTLSDNFSNGMTEPLQSSPSGSSREGTGIGLALTRELVKLMGGTIDAISPAPEMGG